MEILFTVLLFILGIILIVKGGDWFVDAASWIAHAFGIPKFIVGATVVSLATTLPEMIVSLIAAAEGKAEVAAGNAIGSVTANIGLILGISVLVLPSVFKRSSFAFKAFLMLSAGVLLYLLSAGGSLKLLPSMSLLLIFAIFVWDNVKCASEASCDYSRFRPKLDKKTVIINAAKFVFGTVGIVIGARLLVDNGSDLARLLGISEGIIAVTIIAVGTSLPELVTTIASLVKKQASLSVGNIIGANIIDLALILPLSALVSGGELAISRQTLVYDLPAFFAIGLIAVVPTVIKQKFYRWQGVALLLAYLSYVLLVVLA